MHEAYILCLSFFINSYTATAIKLLNILSKGFNIYTVFFFTFMFIIVNVWKKILYLIIKIFRNLILHLKNRFLDKIFLNITKNFDIFHSLKEYYPMLLFYHQDWYLEEKTLLIIIILLCVYYTYEINIPLHRKI